LAKNHGIKDIAVIEKDYIGGGNSGRNTEVVRSNYLWDDAAKLYEFSLKLWQNLSSELNFNVMYTKKGVLSLGHSLQEMRDISRRVNANSLNGIDSELLNVAEVKKKVPLINVSPDIRYPILGASFQPRGGTAHHDAMVWGFARAASSLGVDIIEDCEVVGTKIDGGKIIGVDTTKGFVSANKVAVAVAGNSSVLAQMARIKLPIETYPLQAWVTEPIKPCLDVVVMSNTVHAYLSQTTKGDLVAGAGIDPYTSYAQHGGFHVLEDAIAAIVELFPVFSRLRMLRQWAGIVDVSPDACPIIGQTDVRNLYINCGWGTGGYKATPGSGWVFAHTIANDKPHVLNEPFSIERFETGRLIDEHGAAGVAH
jgi:sarcosine oxidase subunit beta